MSALSITPTLAQEKADAVGLKADYYKGYFYDELGFFQTHTPAITDRIIDKLQFEEAEKDNFDIGSVATYYSPGMPDEFSARYRGKLYITTPGTYTFYLGSDDGASVWFDNDSKPVASNIGDKFSYREVSATKVLSAGFHDITVYYGEHGGSQGLVLEYANKDNGLVRQVIPNGVFYPVLGSFSSPVLTDFKVTARYQAVTLDWYTQTERNSRSFVVERSLDGKNFQELVQQSGAGTSPDPHTYQAQDPEAPIGIVYYRLRQDLTNEKQVYSPIKAVTIEQVPSPSFTVYPNPNAGKFYLELQQYVSKVATLELFDMSGRRQFQQELLANNGEAYHVAPQVATGMYILQVKTSTGTLTQKVVVAK
ncbi:T9SS type A sorting domain-containing protein [Hymenobacter sp. GOD-10R]|uniref:T9SS type A sorting domain-containing protein n=1 Tax=Hymenobacter sp. GOD-10R TaxID=3093922 RepID=UPI002D78BF48|nr:T9SS type A sorting domain-containing protein [Hymenobacter sp. GOD-10R]WRQ27273.1 T9SS type A sorting domain-containing protein [Hymenobacter sp. GOD-10R]